jgi:hypothetical protein
LAAVVAGRSSPRSTPCVERCDQLVDLVAGVGVAKYREPEGGFGDEHVALYRLERRAGRIGAALVIARDDDPLAAIFEQDLRGAEHVPGRNEGRADIAELVAFAVGDRVAGLFAIACVHDRERLGGRPHCAVSAARMIGMAMRHQRARGGA